jgi:hypothetical protein
LQTVILFLRFIQYLKTNQYSAKYGEHFPSRGSVGKELNKLLSKMKDEFDELDTILRNSASDPHLRNALDVRRAIAALRSAHSEYLFRLSDFIYVHGPGTIVYDFI